jgi:hypothetical protein
MPPKRGGPVAQIFKTPQTNAPIKTRTTEAGSLRYASPSLVILPLNASDHLKKFRVEESVTEDSSSAKGNYTYFQERSKTGYVGLSNQGATCYLNRYESPFFFLS